MDGELSKKENDYLAKWGRSKQLSDTTIVRLFDEAKKEKAAGLIPTQKDDLLYLIALSLEDGELSTAELKHLHLFGSSLGMSRLKSIRPSQLSLRQDDTDLFFRWWIGSLA